MLRRITEVFGGLDGSYSGVLLPAATVVVVPLLAVVALSVPADAVERIASPVLGRELDDDIVPSQAAQAAMVPRSAGRMATSPSRGVPAVLSVLEDAPPGKSGGARSVPTEFVDALDRSADVVLPEDDEAGNDGSSPVRVGGPGGDSGQQEGSVVASDGGEVESGGSSDASNGPGDTVSSEAASSAPEATGGGSESTPGGSDSPGSSPGGSASAPGHSGSAPGNSGSASGPSGDAGGSSGSAPGRDGASGSSDSAPGQTKAAGT